MYIFEVRIKTYMFIEKCQLRGNFTNSEFFLVLYFAAFGLNIEIYSVNLYIHSEFRKIRTRKNPEFVHYSCSG